MEEPPARILNRHVAVDNVCAWPNLSVLPDGSVGALLFNKPSHGRLEGDIEFWTSAGGTEPWERRSVVTRHGPGTVRMNVAGGVSADGTIVASSDSQVALEGLGGAADTIGKDGIITITELFGYIESAVPDLTYGKWGYEQVPQKELPREDFPFLVK